MTKTAFITGITGQDGSYLAELLLAQGYRVVGLARRSTNHIYPNIAQLAGRIELEYGDLLDASALATLIRRHQPDEVYNLASQSVPGDSWSQPLVTGEITALGTLRMLEAVRQHCPGARFYQATSREIYGGVAAEVVDEDTPFHANNPYGIAKLYAHQMAVNYRESWDMFVCAGMLFNHESPRRGLHFVTRKVSMGAACIRLGISDPPLNEAGQPLVQDGLLRLGNLDAWRDWGYAKEYVEAMWLMLQQDTPRDYVIGTNTAWTIRDLCRVAFAHVGLDWEAHVVSDEQFLRPTEIFAQRGNPARAKEALGWEPQVSFEALIHMMVDADLKRLGA